MIVNVSNQILKDCGLGKTLPITAIVSEKSKVVFPKILTPSDPEWETYLDEVLEESKIIYRSKLKTWEDYTQQSKFQKFYLRLLRYPVPEYPGVEPTLESISWRRSSRYAFFYQVTFIRLRSPGNPVWLRIH